MRRNRTHEGNIACRVWHSPAHQYTNTKHQTRRHEDTKLMWCVSSLCFFCFICTCADPALLRYKPANPSCSSPGMRYLSNAFSSHSCAQKIGAPNDTTTTYRARRLNTNTGTRLHSFSEIASFRSFHGFGIPFLCNKECGFEVFTTVDCRCRCRGVFIFSLFPYFSIQHFHSFVLSHE